MTDAGLVRAVAEKVMALEGPWCDCDWASLDLGDGFCHDCEKKVMPNPLTCDSDACAVLDKMAADGWYVNLQTIYEEQRWKVEFSNGQAWEEETWVCGIADGDRRRAIVLAALRAKGIATDTPKAG